MAHSGIYRLEQFGAGALPFDIVICGRGRGTLRVLGDRAIVDLPEGVIEPRATRDITDRDALLDALGAEFGCRLRLVGKAVVLPTMLSREFSMVLLERASVYVPQTHRFLRLLRRAGIEFPLNSIVRLHLETWDALAAAEVDRLPRIRAFLRPNGSYRAVRRELAPPPPARVWLFERRAARRPRRFWRRCPPRVRTRAAGARVHSGGEERWRSGERSVFARPQASGVKSAPAAHGRPHHEPPA